MITTCQRSTRSAFRFVRGHPYALRILAGTGILIAFLLVTRTAPVAEVLEWLNDWIGRQGAWAPVVFVALFIGLTSLLLPAWPLNVAAGTLFGPLAGGAMTSLSSTGAAAVSFLVGRYLARDWLGRQVRRSPKLSAILRALGRERGWKVVAAVRLSHALPFGLQNYLLGVSPVRFWPYLLTTWLITLPGIFLVAYLGHLAGAAVTPGEVGVSGWWLRVAGVGVAGLALTYLGKIVYRALKEEGNEASTTSGK